MQVKTGGRLCLDARAAAEAIDDLLFHDYYSRTARLRLTSEAQADDDAEIVLEEGDVARLVECALTHPSLNMQQAVLTAIWRHPDSFRAVFGFGLRAPEAFPEIRRIVAEELAKMPAPATGPGVSGGKTLLPKLPLPPHLRRRGRE